MKKRIALLLAAMLLISMAACGSPEPEVKIKQMAPASTEPANPEKMPEPTPEPTKAPSAAPEPMEATAAPAAVPVETPEPTPEIVAITPTAPAEAPAVTRSNEKSYVLNTNTMKFHLPTCGSVKDIKESNRKDVTLARDDIIAQGFSPCGRCHP